MKAFLTDLVLAVRTLRRAPVFTAVALLILALCIGVTTAVVSVADATLFRAPGVTDSDGLVAMWTTCRRGAPRCSSSYPDFLDYRSRSRTLEDLAAYGWRRASLATESGARAVLVQLSSGNYFELLGVSPAHGRLFGPGLEPEERVVVLSHGLWLDLGGDPSLVGRSLRLNGEPFTVIGITPAGFRGLHVEGGPDLFVPLGVVPSLGIEAARLERRGNRWLSQLVGRLAEGQTPESAAAEMRAISDLMAAEEPEAGEQDAAPEPSATPLRQVEG